YTNFKTNPAGRERYFLDLATVFLLAQHLIFFKMGDQYLLSITPLLIIGIASYASEELKQTHMAAVYACLVALAGACLWARGILVYQEARWNMAERGRRSGISVDQIYGPWAWNCYYRFPEFMRGSDGTPPRDIGDMFSIWLPAAEKEARYLVRTDQPLPGE